MDFKVVAKVYKIKEMGEQFYVCDEPGCDFATNSPAALGSHKRYTHDKASPVAKDSGKKKKVDVGFYCPICGSVMEIEFIGTGRGRYQLFTNCPVCRRK